MAKYTITLKKIVDADDLLDARVITATETGGDGWHYVHVEKVPDYAMALCGHLNPWSANFCATCGKPIDAGPTAVDGK